MATELFLVLLSGSFLLTLLTFLSFRSAGGRKTGKPNYNLPPGDLGGWPLIGDTIPFMQPHSSGSLGDFLDRRVAAHGQIFRMNFLGKKTVVSSDPEFNRFVLQGEGRLFECSYPTSIAEIMGRWSMLAINGDIHREMRSIAVGFMSGVKLRSFFLADVEQQAVDILGGWRDGGSFSAQEEAKKFAFNLMVKHLMSMEAGRPDTEQLRKEYITFMKGMASMPVNLPGTHYRKALQSRSTILKIMGKKLDERVKSIQEGMQGLEEDDLLASVAKNTSLTREQILDLILSMLFAGHETSSAAISLAIFFLQASPPAFQQLKEEHSKIARRKMDMGEIKLNWDDYKQMEFTHCVINETLRLGNVVKFLHRKTIRDVQYKGYDIPCGWEVIPILSAAHLDPSIYDDPQQFNPWRWQGIVNSISMMNKNIMCFSGGPRLCPGAELAKLEMAVFLHYLIRSYTWELAEHDYPVSFPFLGFPKGLPIKIFSI
ncbi:Cytochrome P450 90B1 [Apostasia shenzhenica]|uniref:Cytochrome P450 90B1 n=1 Tax=Apostasia shenzhenica TaxID=1088818 RepID=A0A2I0B2B1_9ASPA|nr:Cytochrome P450 90B1 [Apostasia shenzhenica]